jgi:hypothetical protein
MNSKNNNAGTGKFDTSVSENNKENNKVGGSENEKIGASSSSVGETASGSDVLVNSDKNSSSARRNKKRNKKRGSSSSNPNRRNGTIESSINAGGKISSGTNWLTPTYKGVIDRKTGRCFPPIVFDPITFDPCANDSSTFGVTFGDLMEPFSLLPFYAMYRHYRGDRPFDLGYIKKYFRYNARAVALLATIKSIEGLYEEYKKGFGSTTASDEFSIALKRMFEECIFIDSDDYRRSLVSFNRAISRRMLPPQVVDAIADSYRPTWVEGSPRDQVIIPCPCIPLLLNKNGEIVTSRSMLQSITIEQMKSGAYSWEFSDFPFICSVNGSERNFHNNYLAAIQQVATIMEIGSGPGEDSEHYLFTSFGQNAFSEWNINPASIDFSFNRDGKDLKLALSWLNRSYPMHGAPEVKTQEYQFYLVNSQRDKDLTKKMSLEPVIEYAVPGGRSNQPSSYPFYKVEREDQPDQFGYIPVRNYVSPVDFWVSKQNNISIDPIDLLGFSIGCRFSNASKWRKAYEGSETVLVYQEPGFLYLDNNEDGKYSPRVFTENFERSKSNSFTGGMWEIRDIYSAIGRYSYPVYTTVDSPINPTISEIITSVDYCSSPEIYPLRAVLNEPIRALLDEISSWWTNSTINLLYSEAKSSDVSIRNYLSSPSELRKKRGVSED